MNTSTHKKWFRNASALALTALIAILGPVEKAHAKTGLVVVTLGLRDEANDDWVGIASNLGPAEDRWVVKQVGAPTYYRRLTHVPLDNVIAIPANADRDEIQTLLARVAKAPDAVVVVNMDPGSAATAMTKTGGRISPRRWAARVVGLLAQEHLALFPASQMTWIGHGEGAEPMAMVPDKGQGTRRHLFDRMVAMSPSVMTARYPRRTLIVVADGDAPFRRFRGASNGAAAKVIASMGYRVLRVMDQALKAGFSSPARSALTAASCGALIGYGGASLMNSAHASAYASSESHETSNSGGQMVYYSPATAAPTQMQAPDLGNALTTVTNNDSETNIVNNGPTTNINNENTTNVDNSTTNITDNPIYNPPPDGPVDEPPVQEGQPGSGDPNGPGEQWDDPNPGSDDEPFGFGHFMPMTLTAPVIEPNGGGTEAGSDGNGGGTEAGSDGNGGGTEAGSDGNGGGTEAGSDGNGGGTEAGSDGNNGGTEAGSDGNSGGTEAGSDGNGGGTEAGSDGNNGGTEAGSDGNGGGTGAAVEQPAEEQPAEEQPAEQQPAEQQPAEEQPAEQQPAEQQPAEEQPAEQQPAQEVPANSGPS
ncbi:MAG TPA: hypothetical protein VK786_01675 [bacterium]|nr:hypothetical protein [bacterium]